MKVVNNVEKTNIKKNFAYNIAYQILIIILPLITTPYVSRVLGVDGVGTYSYTYSIAYYFCLFGMLGISNHGNRSVALSKSDKNKLSETFWNNYIIQLLASFLSLICYFLFIIFFFDGNKTIAYIDSIFLLSYMIDISWFFFGLEQFKMTVTRNTIIKVSTIIFIFIFVKNPGDLWKYTLILSLGTFLSQLYLWFHLRKYITFKKPEIAKIKKNIKPILLLFIPVISYSIYKVMDKIMLGNLSEISQVGLYENAEKVVGIPLSIITAFGTVMMPRISTLVGENNKDQINQYTKLSFKYFTIIVSAMTFGLVGISEVFSPVFFGKEFTKCAPLIAGLSFTLIFLTWANIIRTQYLIPNKKDKPYIISMICGAIVNFIANCIFIPILKAPGALIGTILAEFIVFFVQFLYVRKEMVVFKHIKNNFIYLFFGLIMCIVVYYEGMVLSNSLKTLIIQIVSGGLLYIVLVLFYMYIKKDQDLFNILKSIKKSRRSTNE